MSDPTTICLQMMRLEPHIYLVGGFLKRVTLYAQQVRALNLIYSLWEVGDLRAGSHVGIVGAGLAGLTAAAAALAKGCRVTLVEEQECLLHLFQGTHHRWLHPTQHDWPNETEPAQLPFLAWDANWAEEVRRQVQIEWNRFSAPYHEKLAEDGRPMLLEHFGAARVQVVQESEKPVLCWSGYSQEEVDCVILAIGLGSERKSLVTCTAPPLPYWRGDGLDSPNERQRRYFISGPGDGGLTDVLRTRMRDFPHREVAKELIEDALEPADREQLKRDLSSIEHEAQHLAVRGEKGEHISRFLNHKYAELKVPESLRTSLRARLRKDTVTFLHGKDRVVPSLGASVINRFLVHQLLRIKAVDYVFGDILAVETVTDDGGSRYRVRVDDHFEPIDVDEVVIRHGPDPALRRFPRLYEKHKQRLRALGELEELIRRPLWELDWWSAGPAGQPPADPPKGLALSGHRLNLMRSLEDESTAGESGSDSGDDMWESTDFEEDGLPQAHPVPAGDPRRAWCRFDLPGLARFVDPNEAARFFPALATGASTLSGLRDRAAYVYQQLVERRLLSAAEERTAPYRRLRPVEQLFVRSKATASEAACLYAALCRLAGMYPVLLLVRGKVLVAVSLRHAGDGEFAERLEAEPDWRDLDGCWEIWPGYFTSANYVILDPSISLRAPEGTVEGPARAGFNGFEAAVEAGGKALAGWQIGRDGLVDVTVAHERGYGPRSEGERRTRVVRVLSACLRGLPDRERRPVRIGLRPVLDNVDTWSTKRNLVRQVQRFYDGLAAEVPFFPSGAVACSLLGYIEELELALKPLLSPPARPDAVSVLVGNIEVGTNEPLDVDHLNRLVQAIQGLERAVVAYMPAPGGAEAAVWGLTLADEQVARTGIEKELEVFRNILSTWAETVHLQYLEAWHNVPWEELRLALFQAAAADGGDGEQTLRLGTAAGTVSPVQELLSVLVERYNRSQSAHLRLRVSSHTQGKGTIAFWAELRDELRRLYREAKTPAMAELRDLDQEIEGLLATARPTPPAAPISTSEGECEAEPDAREALIREPLRDLRGTLSRCAEDDAQFLDDVLGLLRPVVLLFEGS